MTDFENTYKNTYSKVFGIACKMLNDKDAAKDIVQEVFVYYYEKNKRGFQAQHIQAWLTRAVINKSIDFLKKQKKYSGMIAMSGMAMEEGMNLEIKQRNSLLHHAMSKLKPTEMKILVLYSEAYSYKEIAEIAGVKFSSVGKTIARSLSKLKIILKEMNYEMY